MSLLKSTVNTRDLGGRKTKHGLITVANRIIRSDYNNNLFHNQIDLYYLKSNKINTLIDMRTYDEIKKGNNIFNSLDNFKYFNIPIKEGSQIPKTLDNVPLTYMEIASSKNIKNIFEKIANSKNGVMFYCNAGKDRSGVVTAIIYMLCEVLENEIVDDYMLSKNNLKDLFEKIKYNNENIDINIIIPKESYILIFMKMFQEKYGNVKNYLEIIGLSLDDIDKLKNKLLKP